ncbi:ATP-grasp domain-containing protein [Sulfuricurvum sp.]|uniref:ATP-grasp domain-containing protein n=1 Tax=Sulfuricurvum sp. TaxID=2025608 RepID=UPI003566F01F
MREIRDKSSMFLWYPLVKDLPIPQPKTEMYRFDEMELELIQDERIPDTIFEHIKPLADKIGFPLFMRTDFSSCKHGWEKTCYVETSLNLKSHIFELLTDSMMQGWMTYSDHGIVLREFVPLVTGFTAFHGNLPINKERRYFIRDGKVQCHHPYWYPDAITGHTKQDNWRFLVGRLNQETKPEIELLTKYAEMVGTVVEGYWSVDFAMGKDGKWYLFDMAEGDKSFHWLECEHCPKDMYEQYKHRSR